MSNELSHATGSLTISSVNDLARISNIFADSGYFRDAREAAQIAVKIMAGQGWGIAPFDAVNGIHIIEGKPALGAGLMAGKVKGSGRYDYRVREMSSTVCRLEFFEGEESLGVSEFTMQDATAAGVSLKDRNNKPTPWAKFPRNMLFARAMSNGVKWYCPDVFTGPVYTPEELGVPVDDEGNIIEAELVQPRPAAAEPEPEAAEDPFPEPPGTAEPADVMSTRKQWQALGIASQELKLGDDEAGKQRARDFWSWLAGRDPSVSSVKDFTMEEAGAILDRVGSGENGSYRTDPVKLHAALDAWHEAVDFERSFAKHGEPDAEVPA